jgi:hypothetical protein
MSDHGKQKSPDHVVWEYRELMATPIDKLMAALNKEAADGWELVCVAVENPYYRAFLKRARAE